MSEFKQGEYVVAIYAGGNIFRVGEHGCTAIKVVMENGQMSGVPWFVVYVGTSIVSKWNGALVNTVIPRES